MGIYNLTLGGVDFRSVRFEDAHDVQTSVHTLHGISHIQFKLSAQKYAHTFKAKPLKSMSCEPGLILLTKTINIFIK